MNFNRLVSEWAWRVNDGMPDPKNRTHVEFLRDVLRESGYAESFIQEYTQNLTEAEKFRAKSKESGQIVVYKSKENMEKAIEDGTAEPLDAKDEKETEEKPEKDPAKLSAADGDFERRAVDKNDEKPKESKPTGMKPGKLSDSKNPYSDGKIKQKALEVGFQTKDGFRPAPGNASSMMNEIMSGEVGAYLESNPTLSDEEITDLIYKQLENTAFADRPPVGVGSGKTDKKTGRDKGLLKKAKIAAKAGKKKHERTRAGIEKLQADKILGEKTETFNFYGHTDSLTAQEKMIESSDGPFYTSKGKKVPKPELINLIKNSGGGENPSDTATITKDEQGRMMVEFHSDKQDTNDLQGSSMPSGEFDKAIGRIEKDKNLSSEEKTEIKGKLQKAQTDLKNKEDEISEASIKPAIELSKKPISEVLDKINSDPSIKKKLAKSLRSRGKPHPYLNNKKYLPEKEEGEDYTDEELLTAFLKASSDPNNDFEPTRDPQQKLLMRISKVYGVDPTEELAKIRKESLKIMQDSHKELNTKEVTLPNGNKKPLGDYIEANNIIDVLHLGVIDKDGHGVGKYDGLFNVNMGGTIVDEDVLKKCLGVDNTEEFTGKFETGTVEDGDSDSEKYMYKTDPDTKEKRISGRNVMVYYVVGEQRIPIAKKTQRGGDGPTSKLRSTYSWSKDMQTCFKGDEEKK